MQNSALKKFSEDPLLEIPYCFSLVCMAKEVIHSKIQILREDLIGTKVLFWQREKNQGRAGWADPSVQAL